MAFLDGDEASPEVVAEIEREMNDPNSFIRFECRRIARAVRTFTGQDGPLPLPPGLISGDEEDFANG